MAGNFLNIFWRKSFIGDLRRAKKSFDDDTQWILEYQGKEHRFQFIWIQGLCTKVNKYKDTMTIEDATGQATIQNCSSIPDILSTNEGDYVMIGGKLIDSSTGDSVRIYPYKIQTHQNFSKQEQMWPYEVIDISQRVYYKI